MKKSKFELAVSFAERGIPVIPVLAKNKIPGLKDWPNNGTTNIEEIQEWFEVDPERNYGVLTGHGCVVLDIDVRDGKRGFESLHEIDGFGGIPDTFTVQTPSGGVHYYFSTNEALVSKKPSRDIDFQASGKFVVGPGSALEDGVYEVASDAPIAPIPDWLLELVKSKKMGLKNKDSIPVPVMETHALDQAELGSIERSLNGIDPDLPYDDWIKAIFAVFNIWGIGDETIESLLAWSSQGQKFDEGEFWKKVYSYNPMHLEQVGLPTLQRLAAEHPRKHVELPYQAEADDVEKTVFDTLLELMAARDNSLSANHIEALRPICKALAHGVYEKERKFRIAFPLETGMGKTTAVRALAKVLQETDKSLLIAAERIEQLEELRQAMLEDGIPAWKVGIFHRSEDKYPKVKSVNLEELGTIQFLLVSHNKVKADSQRDLSDRLNVYQGRKRDLVIWDESLMTSNGYAIKTDMVIRAAKDWHESYQLKLADGRRSPEEPEVYEELNLFFLKVIEQLKVGASLNKIVLNLEAYRYKQPIKNISHTPYTEALIELVNYSKRGEARAIKLQEGSALIQFVQTIDDSIDQMIILDASARIRDLLSFDSSVGIYPLKATKDYSDVTVHWADIKSSKKSFDEDKGHLTSYLKEADHILMHHIPHREEVLVFTFKDQEDAVRKYLTEMHPLHNFHVLHWGEHRATNKYAHVRNVITIGVLYRNRYEIAASIIGQTHNLHHPLVDREVREVELSEQADMLYQGFSRGNSRNTFHGKAGEQTIYLFHPKRDAEKVLELLREAMPGIKVENYISAHIKPKIHANASRYRALGDVLTNFLVEQPPGVTSLSIGSLRNQLCPDVGSNSPVWRKAKVYALDKLNNLMGWEQKDLSLVRCSAMK